MTLHSWEGAPEVETIEPPSEAWYCAGHRQSGGINSGGWHPAAQGVQGESV